MINHWNQRGFSQLTLISCFFNQVLFLDRIFCILPSCSPLLLVGNGTTEACFFCSPLGDTLIPPCPPGGAVDFDPPALDFILTPLFVSS